MFIKNVFKCLLFANLALLTACNGTLVSDSESKAELAARLAQKPTEQMLANDDGPYAFYQNNHTQLEVLWLCDNHVVTQQQYIQQPIPVKCGYQKQIHAKPLHPANQQARFSASKIAAVSDIHGQFGVFVELLINNGIITDTWEWNFGDGHLVIPGDIFDRGPQQTEALWLIYQLEQQAMQYGGRVHLLLGNHETMVLYDDLRYLNAKYSKVADAFGHTFPELYGKNTVLGAWLRSLPVIVTVNNIMFMHGGLHPDFLDLNMTIAEVNDAFRESLGVIRPELQKDPVLNFLYRSKGPLWYRGYFRERDAIDSDMLNTLLEAFEVEHIVVGHTSFFGVFEHWDGRVYNVDSNMKRGESSEILFWQAGDFTRGTFLGERTQVPKWQPKQM